MKIPQLKTLSALLLGSTALGALPGLSAQTWPVLPKVSSPPTIDGTVDQIWYASLSHPFMSISRGVIDDADDLSAVWHGLWDDDYLYLLVEVTDNVLEDDAGEFFWQNDVMEIYFNMDNVKPGGNAYNGDNYQYTFGWNKPNEEAGSNADWTGVEWAQVNTANGYLNEIRMPWSTLTTLSIQTGFSFGFDIAVNDNDGQPAYDAVLYWYNQGGGLYGNIDGAGTVNLGDVFNGNYPPFFVSLDELSVDAGASDSLTITANDINTSDTLSFSFTDLPAFLSPTDNGDGTVALASSAQSSDIGTYVFEVAVSDGSREISSDVYLIVKDPNVAQQVPTFESFGPISAREGERSTYTITVQDLDDFSVTFGEGDSTWPDFAVLSEVMDKSVVLQITPAFGDAGNYSFDLTASDDEGNVATADIDFTVDAGVVLTEFYCDPVNGDIANSGSSDAPWGSLQEVFEAGKSFKPGDTIYLRSGYHGIVDVTGANSDYVTIKPEDGAEPLFKQFSFDGNSSKWILEGIKISGEANGTFNASTYLEISGSDIIARDIYIESVADTSAWTAQQWTVAGNGVRIYGPDVVVEDIDVRNVRFGIESIAVNSRISRCTIINFSGDGIRPTRDGAIVEDCYIANCINVDDNHDDGIQSWSLGSEGVGSGTISNIIIRRNTIIENTDPNNPFPGPLQGMGFFDGFYENFLIENNVVIVGTFHGISLYGAINCTVRNNTVIDLKNGQQPWIALEPHKTRGASTGNLVINNLASVMASVSSSEGVYSNNIVVPAVDFSKHFVNYPFNLALKASSPAINAGRNADAAVEDRTGGTRLTSENTIVDVGAYEYNSWRGWPIVGSWSFSEGLLGWLEVSSDPWAYAYSLNSWVFIPAAVDSSSDGAWVWFLNGN